MIDPPTPEQDAAFVELIRQAEELGLYDLDPSVYTCQSCGGANPCRHCGDREN